MAIGTTAALIGAGIAAAGSVASSAIGAKASKDAAKTIAAGQDDLAGITQDAVDKGTGIIDTANTDLGAASDEISGLYDPFTEGASDSVQQLRDLSAKGGDLDQKFSFNGEDFEKTPGYEVTLRRGQQALERSAAAQGGLFSTNTLKRLNDYAQDTTNTYFNDAFGRAIQTFNANRQGAQQRASTLQNLAQLALSGTAAKGNTASSFAGMRNSNTMNKADLALRGAGIIGSAKAGAANAQAAGQVGSANSWSQALQQGGNSLNQFLMMRGMGLIGNNTNNGNPADSGDNLIT